MSDAETEARGAQEAQSTPYGTVESPAGQSTEAAEANQYNTMGIAQASQNMLRQAIASFSKAIEIDPANPGYYYNRGIALVNEGAFSEAIEDFSKALEIRGEDADILNNRGSVYAM